MEGKEAIIAKIINNAENLAKSAVKEAEEHAGEKLSKVKSVIKESESSLHKEVENIKSETVRHKVTVAELEVRKLKLTAKREVMEGVFSKAQEKVALSDNYPAMIEKMIADYAENGDIVIASERDKALVTRDFVEKIAKTKGINLSLSEKYGSFFGGVVLSNQKYDKNLTLEVLFKAVKEKSEAELAEILFE